MPRPMSTASCTSARWPSSSTGARTSAEEAAEPGRVILNHEVTDIASRGPAGRGDRGTVRGGRSSTGRTAALSFATYGDPDGNLVQLIQLTPEYWAKKRTRQAGSPVARSPLRDGSSRCASRPRISSEPDASTPTSSGSSRRRSGRVASATSAAERRFVVYQSTGRASGEFTQMGFYVADIESTVAELRERGVQFEEVDRPGMRTIGGHRRHRGPLPVDRRRGGAGRVVPRQRGQPPRRRSAGHGRLTGAGQPASCSRARIASSGSWKCQWWPSRSSAS